MNDVKLQTSAATVAVLADRKVRLWDSCRFGRLVDSALCDSTWLTALPLCHPLRREAPPPLMEGGPTLTSTQPCSQMENFGDGGFPPQDLRMDFYR